ncbi:hypothetical protein SNOG_15308 [Parastagonospora nodorum SN15]|nr:hypothetical protein SNOG_15308 [Parastagonospora nodorum SN15]EAT77241.1 hypothetical protein SNOG_15308 [Parastagonospora nodorum SN15]
MTLIYSRVLILLLLSITVHCKTYFVHESCSAKDGWNKYMNEALSFAKKSAERLNSDSDTDFAAVYKRIFQAEKSSPNSKYIRETVGTIADLTPTTDLKASDIRFHCDNGMLALRSDHTAMKADFAIDERWQKKSRGWHDPVHDMILRASGGTPSCHGQAKGVTYGARAIAPTDASSPRAGQNPARVVISICDSAFKSEDGSPLYFSDDLKQQDLEDSPIDNLAVILSITIIHELAHAVTGLEIRDLPNQASAYTWDNVINKATDVASKNAENYAYLALWAGIADAGYTLPRVRNDLPDVVKKELENDCKEGYLRKYKDITKRWVSKIEMSFVA